MKRHLALSFSTACFLLFFSTRYSLAACNKWATTGPCVNEIAHLLFFGAMVFFIYEIRLAGLEKFRGFRYLLWAWTLLALWNLDAFVNEPDWSMKYRSDEAHTMHSESHSLSVFQFPG